MTEAEFLTALRSLPLHPGALALHDDAARLGELVLTTDLIAEDTHFLPTDPPGDVAWKLVAVNLSDLAAKGAVPEGVLLGYPLSDDSWDAAFLAGLHEALTTFACPLLGGDTIRANGARTLSITAIGRAPVSPVRAGAKPGDTLWVTGTIGDAGAGLQIAQGRVGPRTLLQRYRRPTPRLDEGRKLAGLVHAMMDVSDGLLIDAGRMADASGLAVAIDLAALPLSFDYLAFAGADITAHLAAATAGDDYELLFALAPADQPPLGDAFAIGSFAPGAGLSLTFQGAPVPLPPRLGFEHS